MTEFEFDDLIRIYGKDILRFCRVAAGGLEGDELYQDTLLTLWEQRERLDVSGNVKSYALSVAIRLWKNKKRKYARRKRLVPSSSFEEGAERGNYAELSDDACVSPEQKAMERETEAEVRTAVRSLKENYRQVILLYYSADLKTREIAECLGIPENTVKTRLRKAKEILKAELEGKIYG